MDVAFVLGGLLFAVFGVGALGFGSLTLRRWHRVRTTDRISIRDASIESGPVEIEGRIRPYKDVLTSPILERECVVYEYAIEERRRKPGRNGNQNEYRWKKLDSGSARRPFLLEDDTGTAYIDPDGASLSLSTERTSTIEETESLPSGLRSTVESPLSIDIGNIALSGGRRLRYTEKRLDVGGRGYVFGQTEPSPTGVDADVAIGKGDRGPTFLISDTGERETMRRLLLQGVGISAFGLLFLAMGSGFLAFGLL